MSSRISGAILALAAAILLLISIAGSSWWDGHPYTAARTYTQIAHVGLHGAELCMDDGHLETCKTAPTHSLFGPVAWIELLACVLLLASVVGLAVVLLRDRGDKRTFALAAIGGAGLAIVLALVLIIIAPTGEATIPHGAGLYLFFVGAIGALGAGVLARRPEVARTIQQPTVMPPIYQPHVDYAALMNENNLRPSIPDMSGALAGPAGTLGTESPLFQSAPQLRPLYEVQGAAPVAVPPVLPTRPPTPIPVRPPTISSVAPALPRPFSKTMPPPLPPPSPTKPLFGDGVKPLTQPPPIAQKPLVPPIVPPPRRVKDTDPQGSESVGDSTDVNVPLSQESIDEQLETVAVVKEEPEELSKPSATNIEVRAAPETEQVPVVVSRASEGSRAAAPDGAAVRSTASPDLAPPEEKVAASGPTPACPQCEAPMAWVEEHLRFYCKSCRMYF